MTTAPYFNRADTQHVMGLCEAHATEYVAKGWAPGFGTLGRCELPGFCAACREAENRRAIGEPVPEPSYTTMTYQVPTGDWSWMLFQGRMLIESGSLCASEAEAEAQADKVLASFINDPELAPVSINHGVDYERALECLQAESGRLFRAFREATAIGEPEAVAQARAAYMAAQKRADSLRLHDEEAIRAILGE